MSGVTATQSCHDHDLVFIRLSILYHIVQIGLYMKYLRQTFQVVKWNFRENRGRILTFFIWNRIKFITIRVREIVIRNHEAGNS